jgi:hypothetical protein
MKTVQWKTEKGGVVTKVLTSFKYKESDSMSSSPLITMFYWNKNNEILFMMYTPPIQSGDKTQQLYTDWSNMSTYFGYVMYIYFLPLLLINTWT